MTARIDYVPAGRSVEAAPPDAHIITGHGKFGPSLTELVTFATYLREHDVTVEFHTRRIIPGARRLLAIVWWDSEGEYHSVAENEALCSLAAVGPDGTFYGRA